MSQFPSDPVTGSFADWGFAEHGTYCNVSERPHGSKRPLEFSFTALKDTEKRYTAWEKGLLSLTRALKLRKIQCQPVKIQGPFNLSPSIKKGSAPQRELHKHQECTNGVQISPGSQIKWLPLKGQQNLQN